jgi:Holliday junction resolvase RusA-like endonuclease
MVLFKCSFKVPRHGILKNSKQIFVNKKTGNRFISKSDSAREAGDWIMRALTIHKLRSHLDKPIEDDIAVRFTFCFPRTVYYTKAGPRSLKVPDLDNLCALPLDYLQKAGVIKNDTQVCSLDGTRRKPIDGCEYFLEIEITRMEPENAIN